VPVSPVVVYAAKSITTLNPLAPSAEVIAVAGDRIAACGSREAVLSALKNAGREFTIDESFAGAAMIPGLIEAHSHITSTGGFYQMPAYVGAYPRLGPEGMLAACASKQAALGAIRNVAASVTGPLTAWGYDPTLIEGGEKITAADLDAIDSARPVAVMNMSGHVTYANSVALKMAGYSHTTDQPGVVKDANGRLTGELDELPAEAPLWAAITAGDGDSARAMLDGIAMVADLSQKRGLTTIADLLTQSPGEAEAMSAYAHSYGPKTRIACYYSYLPLAAMGIDRALPFLSGLRDQNDDWFSVAGVKFVSDGSFQTFTAYLANPPYYNGAPNGLFNLVGDVAAMLKPYHDAGIQIAIHANADGALDEVLAALTAVMDQSPRRDNRHRLEHVQLPTAEQIATMAEYGISANIFSKHLKYWGDVHRTMTVGPDLAARMNPARSLIDAGIHTSLHSDAWVTPIDQLESIVCATTRQTRSGFVLGPDQIISVPEALKAVTLDAAYLLREDHIKGSLEPGKLADITVLDREILTSEDAANANPLATVLGGKILPIA